MREIESFEMGKKPNRKPDNVAMKHLNDVYGKTERGSGVRNHAAISSTEGFSTAMTKYSEKPGVPE